MMQNLLKLQTLEFSETPVPRAADLIAELRERIPPQILEHYDRLRVRGKKGLAAVNHEVCMGCHMHVPLGVVMTLKHGQDVQLCENCGRYLFLPEEAAAAPVTTEPTATPVRAPQPVASAPARHCRNHS